MTATQETFIVTSAESATSHEDWLCLMQCKMTALLREPRLLIELIWRESARQVTRAQDQASVPYDSSAEAFKIFEELGLYQR
ncbi:hypothetical protein IAD21_04569 [Abditibacteriota bacterium]|nr:hypothetical protein IAD21_04569 [Abditibacteriota bacterium]